MASKTKFRDRIVGMERIDPDLIDPHPLNYKTHPDKQRRHFRALLEEVGFAGAVLVRRTGKRFQLIGGHMRREEMRQPVPALILDVTPKEALTLIATLDASAEMASTDEDELRALLESFTADTEGFQRAVAELCPLAAPAFDGGGILDPGEPGDRTAGEPVDDDTKQVPLIFNARQFAQFQKLAQKLNAKYDTDNYSDAVRAAFDDWSRKYGKGKARKRGNRARR